LGWGKYTVPVLASILILGAFTVGYSIDDAFAKGNGQPKVTICHVDQETGEEKTISISNKAVSKHLANHIGDHLDECVDVPEPVCGNNVTEAPEECDDGNTVTESCNYSETSCTVCASDCSEQAGATSFCGDSNTDSANGETCDDGNQVNTDGCTNACQLPVCGDSITSPPETCDLGNTSPNLGCPFCQVPTGSAGTGVLLYQCICEVHIIINPNMCVVNGACDTFESGDALCNTACQNAFGVDAAPSTASCSVSVLCPST